MEKNLLLEMGEAGWINQDWMWLSWFEIEENQFCLVILLSSSVSVSASTL